MLGVRNDHAMAFALTSSILLVIVLLNAWATRAVLKDNLSTSGQRVAQIAFVWAIPFLGALFTLHSKRVDEEQSEGRYREIPDLGNDMVSSTHGTWIGREDIGTNGSGSAEGGTGD